MENFNEKHGFVMYMDMTTEKERKWYMDNVDKMDALSAWQALNDNGIPVGHLIVLKRTFKNFVIYMQHKFTFAGKQRTSKDDAARLQKIM